MYEGHDESDRILVQTDREIRKKVGDGVKR